MFDRFKRILGIGDGDVIAKSLKNGAQVIDVRSRAEFASGHFKGSINIPLDELDRNVGRISREKPVVVCCASGMRSGSAKSILQRHGFTVHNGGSWRSVERKLL